jgi:Protein of unknown function (DUF3309)
MSVGTILLIVLILVLVGALPTWPYRAPGGVSAQLPTHTDVDLLSQGRAGAG